MYRRPLENSLAKFTDEAEWLCNEFSRFSQNNDVRLAHFASEMAVIRLHDSWARFCRELIILSAYGKIVTLGGNRLATSLPNIKKRGDVLPVLQSLSSNGRQYWKWHSSRECVAAAKKLQIENFSTVAAALGASNSPADLLRDIRNFYAHRGKWTAHKAINAGNFTGPHRPMVLQLNDFAAGGATILESWKDTLIAIATSAVQ